MNKFIFRKEYWDKLEGIDTFEKLEAIEDVMNYGLYQQEPGSDVGKVLLNYIRDTMDEDRRIIKANE